MSRIACCSSLNHKTSRTFPKQFLSFFCCRWASLSLWYHNWNLNVLEQKAKRLKRCWKFGSLFDVQQLNPLQRFKKVQIKPLLSLSSPGSSFWLGCPWRKDNYADLKQTQPSVLGFRLSVQVTLNYFLPNRAEGVINRLEGLKIQASKQQPGKKIKKINKNKAVGFGEHPKPKKKKKTWEKCREWGKGSDISEAMLLEWRNAR